MNIGQSQLKPPDIVETPIVIIDSAGTALRSFGGDVPQFDGPLRAWNAAGTPYVTLRWQTKDTEIADAWLMDALEIYLSPIVRSDDFWSIEWRAGPQIERDQGRAQIRCRLIVHKRSNRRDDAGILGVAEGYPSWDLPS